VKERLENLRILLGVTGSIAAYKACEILRLLQKEGAEVRVVMTAAARRFVSPLTFETLSKQEVITELFPEGRVVKTRHIGAAEWAQCMLICPATLDCIGKVASGIADDFLTTAVSASRAPVLFAPAMDFEMAGNAIYLANCEKLRTLGYRFISPEEGELASGASGLGRLARPERILDAIRCTVLGTSTLKNRRILVTAGPTRESLDPVRYFSNHSSGKMGLAIAEEAFLRGAQVTLVSGPTIFRCMDGIRQIQIQTAKEMAEAVHQEWKHSDVLVMAAAVADYRPESASNQKIKKNRSGITLRLESTEDILMSAASTKGSRIVVGFALETENGVDNAFQKLQEKKLDLICLNNPLADGSGFGSDTNQITLIDGNRNIRELSVLPKWEAARHLLDAVENFLKLQTDHAGIR
jgi:phosphopantothenoylcysteine decarboxylase/phosphopantothenate--cysteine ligase